MSFLDPSFHLPQIGGNMMLAQKLQVLFKANAPQAKL
jgi:hypothetical protein